MKGVKPGKNSYSVRVLTDDGIWTEIYNGKFEYVELDEEINAGSVLTETHEIIKVEAVAATCEEDGNRQYYACNICGKIFDDAEGTYEITTYDVLIEAVGHHFGEWTVVKTSTLTEEGIQQRICACGKAEYEKIEKLSEEEAADGEKESDVISTETAVTDIPTDCDELPREETENDLTTPENSEKETAKQETDSAEQQPSEKLSAEKINPGTIIRDSRTNAVYKVFSEKGEVVYLEPAKKNVTKITVPSTVKLSGRQYVVSGIADKAFMGCRKLKTVYVGKNVTFIGKKVCFGCDRLKSIVIQTKKLEAVGANAFKGVKTAKITVPSSKLVAYKNLLKGKGQGRGVRITK